MPTHLNVLSRTAINCDYRNKIRAYLPSHKKNPHKNQQFAEKKVWHPHCDYRGDDEDD